MTSIEVVIASYNRPGPLRRTMAALASQRRLPSSVAVIDDCSREPVTEVLSGEQYPFSIRTLRTPMNSGPAVARNLGVSTSDCELIAFVDDDVVPDPGLLHYHAQSFAQKDSQNVSIGPLRAPSDWKPTPWNRWEADTIAIEYARMVRGEYEATWRQFFTGNAMLRREDFLAAGGFDESFSRAEDIEFAYRISRAGSRFIFEPRAIGWHYAERSLKSWRRIPSQYAEFDLSIDRLHPELRWDELVRDEYTRRHLATRAIERLASALRGEGLAASLAVAGACASHAVRLAPLSSNFLSLAFQLEYGRRRRELLRGHTFNQTSTDML
jgi:GT2 family glycosyltransferase